MNKKKKKKKATKVAEKPLAPQVQASFDMTVITAVASDDDVVEQQNADISLVPYMEDDEEALEPPQDKSRIENLTKYSSDCRSFAFSALEFTVTLVLVLLACVFLVVLIKSGKAYGKW